MLYDLWLDAVANPLFVPLVVNVSGDWELGARYRERHGSLATHHLTIAPGAFVLRSLEAMSARSLLFADCATFSEDLLGYLSLFLRHHGFAFVLINLPEPGYVWWAREETIETPRRMHSARSDRYVPEPLRRTSIECAEYEVTWADIYARNRLRDWQPGDWFETRRARHLAGFRVERATQLGVLAVAKYYGLAIDGRPERPRDAPDFTVGGTRVQVHTEPYGQDRWYVLAYADQHAYDAKTPVALSSDFYLFTVLESGRSGRACVTLCGSLERDALAACPLEGPAHGKDAWYYVIDIAQLDALPEEF